MTYDSPQSPINIDCVVIPGSAAQSSYVGTATEALSVWHCVLCADCWLRTGLLGVSGSVTETDDLETAVPVWNCRHRLNDWATEQTGRLNKLNRQSRMTRLNTVTEPNN